jgi:hypothetical protein
MISTQFKYLFDESKKLPERKLMGAIKQTFTYLNRIKRLLRPRKKVQNAVPNTGLRIILKKKTASLTVSEKRYQLPYQLAKTCDTRDRPQLTIPIKAKTQIH